MTTTKLLIRASETRNIIDYYHYWKTEAIKADLDKRRHPFSVLCSNLYNDYNLSCIVRTCNAMLASSIYVYGRRKYDKRGAVGAFNYENLHFYKEIADLEEVFSKYNVVAVDNVEGAVPLDTFEWPKNSLMCFGQEQVGLPLEILERAPYKVYIRQYGSVRSLNVASAASIAMYDWCVKNVK